MNRISYIQATVCVLDGGEPGVRIEGYAEKMGHLMFVLILPRLVALSLQRTLARLSVKILLPEGAWWKGDLVCVDGDEYLLLEPLATIAKRIGEATTSAYELTSEEPPPTIPQKLEKADETPTYTYKLSVTVRTEVKLNMRFGEGTTLSSLDHGIELERTRERLGHEEDDWLNRITISDDDLPSVVVALRAYMHAKGIAELAPPPSENPGSGNEA